LPFVTFTKNLQTNSPHRSVYTASEESVSEPLSDWQPWFDRHQAALLLLARQHVATTEESQDALQEGFVRFWRTRQRARDPVAYLFTCVRSAALDLRRSRVARIARERTAEGDLFVAPVELDDRRQGLETALQTLPPEQREVVVLKIWSELTFAQIAGALHISANTAASRYRYAIARLQTALASEVTHD